MTTYHCPACGKEMKLDKDTAILHCRSQHHYQITLEMYKEYLKFANLYQQKILYGEVNRL